MLDLILLKLSNDNLLQKAQKLAIEQKKVISLQKKAKNLRDKLKTAENSRNDLQNRLDLTQEELQREHEAHQQTQENFAAIPVDWQQQLDNLLQIINELTKTNEKLEKEHEEELARLKSQKDASQSSLDEEKRKVELLHETHKVLNEEKKELQKTIISSQENTKKLEEQLTKSQQTIERLEKELFNCCDGCLIEKEKQEKNLVEAKQVVFQLCQRLNVPLSDWLREKVESATTYWELVKCLRDIHNEKMVAEIRKSQKNGLTEGKAVVSPPGEVNSGVKYFLWATGILTLVCLILAFVKGKIKGVKEK